MDPKPTTTADNSNVAHDANNSLSNTTTVVINHINDNDDNDGLVVPQQQEHHQAHHQHHQHSRLSPPAPDSAPTRTHKHKHKHTPRNCRPTQTRVSILHSSTYTKTLLQTMNYIHQDRDLLLSSLLYHCGFIKDTPNFFHVVEPKLASRRHLELFHDSYYLDLLECTNSNSTCINTRRSSYNKNDNNNNNNNNNNKQLYTILDTFGLVDDCPLPITAQSKALLWKYCLSIVGASIHGMQLLLRHNQDVVIHFGGGRHHAHSNKAGGFCYVNDIVIAIKTLLLDATTQDNSNHYHHHDATSSSTTTTRTATNTSTITQHPIKCLYFDLDIHHCDGVQNAFYDTNEVLTVSFHRYTPGFFPSTTGSIQEKGKYQTSGVGYNLNIPLPKSCTDVDLIKMTRRVLEWILPEYDPEYVVVCVGADGLRGDDLLKESSQGWNLSPEGLAECVRLIALECSGNNNDYDHHDHDIDNQSSTNNNRRRKRRRKLMILGGGGYNPANTARTYLLCTAAACEGARPGMIYELPKDVPLHEYVSRYGPSYELFSRKYLDELSQIEIHQDCDDISCAKGVYSNTLEEGIDAIKLAHLFLKKRNQNNCKRNFCSWKKIEKVDNDIDGKPNYCSSRRRRKKKKE